MGNVYLRFLTRGMCERAQVRYELSKPPVVVKGGNGDHLFDHYS